MATIAPSTHKLRNGDIVEVTWNALTAADAVGHPIRFPEWGDRSIQIAGTFDTATVVIEGSNDGSNYVTLTDVLGNLLSFTSAGLKQVTEVPKYVRPSTSGGGGSQDIDVIMLMRRANDLRT